MLCSNVKDEIETQPKAAAAKGNGLPKREIIAGRILGLHSSSLHCMLDMLSSEWSFFIDMVEENSNGIRVLEGK